MGGTEEIRNLDELPTRQSPMISPRQAICFFLFWMAIAGQSTVYGQEMSDALLEQRLRALKNDSLDALLRKMYLHELSLPPVDGILRAKHVLEIAKKTDSNEAVAK